MHFTPEELARFIAALERERGADTPPSTAWVSNGDPSILYVRSGQADGSSSEEQDMTAIVANYLHHRNGGPAEGDTLRPVSGGNNDLAISPNLTAAERAAT